MVSKGLSERAIERLEESGYLMNVRSKMKAEVMKCLNEMEEQGELPPHLRVKRYAPPDQENLNALAFIADFMRFHGLENSLTCLKSEVKGEIPNIKNNGKMSELAAAIVSYESDGNGPNPLLD